MEIKIYNDKKEMSESFQASMDAEFSVGSSYGDCSIYAYGANEIEAKENLNKLAQTIFKELKELLK